MVERFCTEVCFAERRTFQRSAFLKSVFTANSIPIRWSLDLVTWHMLLSCHCLLWNASRSTAHYCNMYIMWPNYVTIWWVELAELFIIEDTSIPPLNDTTVSISSRHSILAVSSSSQLQHISLCMHRSVGWCIYIVKGNDNANSWVNNPSQDLAEMFYTMHMPVVMICRIHLPFHIESSKKMSTM